MLNVDACYIKDILLHVSGTQSKTNIFRVHFIHAQICGSSIIAYTYADFGHRTRYDVTKRVTNNPY